MTHQEALQLLQNDKNLSESEKEAVNTLESAINLLDNSVDEGYLYDWYIQSVSSDDEPVWTEAHIAELAADFIIIPKPEGN